MTEHQEAHARLSPSSSKGWLKCAGRITLESAYPNTSNEFSDDGTAMHVVAKMCLTEHWRAAKAIGTQVPVNAPNEHIRTVKFTEEMADLTQGYVDTVRALGIGNLMLVEHRVDFTEYLFPETEPKSETGDDEEGDEEGESRQFGTADCIILIPIDTGGFELFVIDLKTGWVRVDPENNSQGMLYALGALAELEMVHDIRRVRIGIYQPKHGGLREWTLSVEDLLAFADVARVAAQRVEWAQRTYDKIVGCPDGGTADDLLGWEADYLHPNPNEEDCRFCRAMATCPAYSRAVKEKLGVEAFSEITEAGMAPPVDHDSPEQLAAAMSATGMIEDWIKAVRAEVERRLLAGIGVEGWGLELGREGARKWTDEEAVIMMMRKKFRVNIEDTFDLSLKSPTSVAKMAPKLNKAGAVIPPKEGEPEPVLGLRQWEKLQPLISRSPPKPSVKPAAEITKPYTPPALTADGFSIQPEGEDLA